MTVHASALPRPSAPVLQRRCACGGILGPDGECAACKARRLQRQAAAAGPGVQSQTEARFGHDFSQVPVLPAAPRGLAREVDPHPPAPDTGGLSAEMLQQIARRLREAMEGWGTDETAIYSALGGRTQSQVDAIASTYASLYHRSLMDDLRDELTDSELRQLGTLAPQHPAGSPEATSPAEQGRLAETVARQLDDAMRGLGTDESAIFSALTGRTQAERTAIKQAYERRTRRTLEADLRDELSGSELTEALMLLNQGMLQVEDELYLAIAGLGTDEDRVFRALDALAGNTAGLQAMEARYRDKYGDLVADLRGDLSGDDYEHALRVLRPAIQDVAFEDVPIGDRAQVIGEIRALIPVGIAKVDRAISALSRGWSGMSAAEQAVFNQYFDPSGSGVDEGFVADVLVNFRSIRREFDNDLTVEYEPGGAGLCSGTRLYYTYWSNIHVCPYFKRETDAARKQRDFVHELTHNALIAVDRPYYQGNRAAYDRMTPRGPWTRNIPFLGPLFTFISRSDTLNSPDAYAYFAFHV